MRKGLRFLLAVAAELLILSTAALAAPPSHPKVTVGAVNLIGAERHLGTAHIGALSTISTTIRPDIAAAAPISAAHPTGS